MRKCALTELYSCPHIDCTMKAALSKLVDHLITYQDCCFDTSCPTLQHFEDSESLERRNYKITGAVDPVNMSWRMRIIKAFGEVFAIFPWKSNRLYYMVVVMFASEDECAEFNLQMTVHKRDSDSLQSDLSLKFSGSPFSVDGEKVGWKLFAISEKFMEK